MFRLGFRFKHLQTQEEEGKKGDLDMVLPCPHICALERFLVLNPSAYDMWELSNPGFWFGLDLPLL